VLGDRRQSLVEDEVQAAMVGANDKAATLEIRPPMAHRLNQPNELSLICGQFRVARCDGLAEECDSAGALMENRAEAGAGGVALDNELAVESRQL
jgi:hypothetical protein